MKIWIDLRLSINNNLYSEFLLILVETLVNKDTAAKYIIYSNHKLDINLTERSQNIVVKEKPWSFDEQFSLKKEFNKENFSLMIFFNHEKPIFYKKNFILFVPSLAELFFATKSFLWKLKYNFLMNVSLKNCKKVVCFDANTQIELNERLNIREEMIEILEPFFITDYRYKVEDGVRVDVKAKYNLKYDYFIYDWTNKANANLTKLFKAFIWLKNKGKNLCLLMLSEETNSDIWLREEVISYNIQDRVFFIWDLNKSEEVYYYQQSIWVIYPSIYDSFPFRLSKAIKYNKPIIAGNIPVIEKFIGKESIKFNPLSTTDLIHAIEFFLENPRIVSYSDIIKSLSREKSADRFKELIYENIYDV